MSQNEEKNNVTENSDDVELRIQDQTSGTPTHEQNPSLQVLSNPNTPGKATVLATVVTNHAMQILAAILAIGALACLMFLAWWSNDKEITKTVVQAIVLAFTSLISFLAGSNVSKDK